MYRQIMAIKGNIFFSYGNHGTGNTGQVAGAVDQRDTGRRSV
jgi:hypothetical protein